MEVCYNHDCAYSTTECPACSLEESQNDELIDKDNKIEELQAECADLAAQLQEANND